MPSIARALMAIGAVLLAAGAALWLADRIGIPIGRLPGDVSYEGKNVKIYAPIATMIVVSVVLTVIMNVISRWKR